MDLLTPGEVARRPGGRGRRLTRLCMIVGAVSVCLVLAVCILGTFSASEEGSGAKPRAEVRETGTASSASPITAVPNFSLAESIELNGAFNEQNLVSTSVNAMGVRATWQVEASVDDAAQTVLTHYQAEDVSLASADYVDLLGNVWGCVVASEAGWSEVVFVDGRGSDGDTSCQVTAVHLAPAAEGTGGQGETSGAQGDDAA